MPPADSIDANDPTVHLVKEAIYQVLQELREKRRINPHFYKLYKSAHWFEQSIAAKIERRVIQLLHDEQTAPWA